MTDNKHIKLGAVFPLRATFRYICATKHRQICFFSTFDSVLFLSGSVFCFTIVSHYYGRII